MLTPSNDENRIKPASAEKSIPVHSRNSEFNNNLELKSFDEFATKEAQACKSSFSGEGFSDIDLADIADEDFTQ